MTTQELVERLKRYQAHPLTGRSDHAICLEAAARLEALEQRVEGLRAMHKLIATNLGEYIDREGSVDVTVALAFETARAGCAP